MQTPDTFPGDLTLIFNYRIRSLFALRQMVKALHHNALNYPFSETSIPKLHLLFTCNFGYSSDAIFLH